MTREEAIKELKREYLGDTELLKQAKLLAIKALEQEPCGDAISMIDVLKIINFEDKWLLDCKGHNANTIIAFYSMRDKILKLPSVCLKKKEIENDKRRGEELDCIDQGKVH